ncbi:hypothetical protein BHE74_00032429, partial [Ensete ventricosum]
GEEWLAITIKEENKGAFESDYGGRRRKRRPRERAAATCGCYGRKGGKEDYNSDSNGWKSRRKQRRLEERATAVASSWQRRQAVGRRCRRRTTTASTMGAGGRRQQSTVKDGRGGQLLQQGRQRRGWEATGQRSPMRGMTEGRPMATVAARHGRKAMLEEKGR